LDVENSLRCIPFSGRISVILKTLLMLIAVTYSCSFSQINLSTLINQKDVNTQSIQSNFSGYKYLSNPSVPTELGVGHALDEHSYLVGGGDYFSVTVIDRPSLSYNGIVDQAGDLFLSGIGLVKIGKIPLDSAKKIIGVFVKEKLHQSESVYVVLTKEKEVSVNISGAVSSPGTYTLTGSLRLFDAIKEANNKLPLPWNDFNYRNVSCVSKDTTICYDLLKFIQSCDLSQNPYVYPGDNIKVGLATDNVMLSGEVKCPISGKIPIYKNEPLSELISMFTFDESADLNNIIVKHLISGDSDSSQFQVLDKNSDLPLQNGDVITVPVKNDYPQILSVKISGEIARPGMYPIQKGQTSVQNLLDIAGGVTPYGDIQRAVIIRRGKILNSKNRNQELLNATKFNMIRPEMNNAMSTMNFTNDHTIIPLNNLDTITLEADDNVYIPKTEQFVFVSGNVKNPGGCLYEKGKGKKYYLSKVGGLKRGTDKTNIYTITNYDEIMQISSGDSIKPGDIIVVPISQQNKTLSTVILPIIQAAATTIGVLIAIVK
jgi:protein involved in polysaccharide export with SLBB domain